MKKLLLVGACLALTILIAPAAPAVAGGNSDWAKRCQTDYAALGFRNVGQCVSHYARGGGGVVTAPASLTLTFDSAPCASNPTQMCLWSVQGNGLDPGSQVIVGEAAFLYGASVTVDSSGNVSAHGIYQIGTCVTAGYEHPAFIARGVSADGTPIASAVVVGDLSLYMPICS